MKFNSGALLLLATSAIAGNAPTDDGVLPPTATFGAGPAQSQGPLDSAEGANPSVRVIIHHTRPEGKTAIVQAAQRVHHELDQISSVAATLPLAAMDRLRSRGDIELIEVDEKRSLLDVVPALPKHLRGRDIRVEGQANSSWKRNLAENTPFGIGMVEAHQLHADYEVRRSAGQAVKVCIIDSGYERDHEDLQSTDADGYSGKGKPTWMDDKCGHGTHVAGTVGALDNELGVIGVAPGSPVYIIKVFDQSRCGWSFHSSDLISAAYRCADNGAHIISMSLGGGGSSTAERDGFKDLYESRNVLPIAAAGNGNSTAMSYPASYPSVMSVAAVDSNAIVADFSQKNKEVDIAAPGVSVESTVPTGTGYIKSLVVDSTSYEQVGVLEGTPDGTATGALMDCKYGMSVCAAAANKVCLIQRGSDDGSSVTFATKVSNCAGGGGIAAIIYNNVAGSDIFSWTLNENGAIPVVSVTQGDGQAILGLIPSSVMATVTTQGGGNYDVYSGTSMATPHVSGVAALVWSLKGGPTAMNAAKLRAALENTAVHPSGSPRDNSYGHGIVKAKAAYDSLSCADVSGCTQFNSACQEPACSSGTCQYNLIQNKCCTNGDCDQQNNEYCDSSYACAVCGVANCNQCKPDGSCEVCDAGYSVSGGSCSACGKASGEKCKNNSECCSGACYVGRGSPRCG
uniref:subtilisin n=1 Tax=Pseudictyota dubia TaxID=2749911 RepID=A0A7R9W0W9_9STRA|mmetsp:Transcript_2832/g.5092  ORF Transcript_2832/g.5092 Transcript_2832/m.5092 type:complete len:683 (+) Transcript_2832:166-2214(+)|eukprot:CAMPEP_0197441274 /NCGR_PEP_ID=MMETSP1175-20131217/7582_1 /TAXON_ID=1003142 /ORGANISM="Triceratium dubium, Strain CCMP147" /LENGTH=682 /DNA_ID=CAMNT_0042971523 /DNA_START=148 /DNA_END=2196 /DNA_ORIENTATION=+